MLLHQQSRDQPSSNRTVFWIWQDLWVVIAYILGKSMTIYILKSQNKMTRQTVQIQVRLLLKAWSVFSLFSLFTSNSYFIWESENRIWLTVVTCTVKPALRHPLKKKKKRPNIGLQDRLLVNAGQKYCRMLQESILQYFRPSLKLQFVFKTLVLSIFEWPLKTGFTCMWHV